MHCHHGLAHEGGKTCISFGDGRLLSTIADGNEADDVADTTKRKADAALASAAGFSRRGDLGSGSGRELYLHQSDGGEHFWFREPGTAG